MSNTDILLVFSTVALFVLILISVRDFKRMTLSKGNFKRELISSGIGAEIVPCESVSFDTILIQIDRLADEIRVRNPDFIAAVHTGGRLLSAIIAEKVGIEENRIIYIGTDRNRRKKLDWNWPKGRNFFGGSLAVIDDISRRGTTLASIKHDIVKKSLFHDFWFDSAFFATLLLRTDRKQEYRRGYFVPDWFGIACADFAQGLPWSSLSERVKSSYSEMIQGREYNKYYIEIHEKLLEDYKFTVRCAFLSINDAEEFSKRVESRTLHTI